MLEPIGQSKIPNLTFIDKKLQVPHMVTWIYGDRIVVMNAGKIEQVGSPQEVYEKPATRVSSASATAASCDMLMASQVAASRIWWCVRRKSSLERARPKG